MPTMQRPRSISSATSSASTTANVCTQFWATCRPPSMSGTWQQINLSSCPNLLDHRSPSHCCWPQTAVSESCIYCPDVANLYCAFHQTTSSACCVRLTQVKLFWSCTSPPNTSGFTYHLILSANRLSATKSKELGRVNGVAFARTNGTVGSDSIFPASSNTMNSSHP